MTVSFPHSSLHQAVKSGDTNAVKAMLDDGADVNAPNDAGQTPLIVAIVAGQNQLLRPLLRAGANPALRDNTGLTASDWAQRKGETELAQSLATHSQSQSNDPEPETTKRTAGEHKTPLPPVEDPPRVPLSSEEKTRRFIAGLKKRLDEKANREVASRPVDSQGQRPSDETVLPSELISDLAHVEEPARDKVTQESFRKTVTTPRPDPVAPNKKEIVTEVDVNDAKSARDKVTRESFRKTVTTPQPETVTPDKKEIVTEVDVNDAKPARDKVTRESFRKTVTTPRPETVAPDKKEIVTEVNVDEAPEPARGFSSPLLRPSSSSSKRKRCPQCGTVYNSELLAYCAYDAVALVDADQPIVPPRPPDPSPLLWVMVVVVMVLGAIAGLYVTSSLLQNGNADTQTVAVPQPPSTQKGAPTLERQLIGKELSLPEAQVPANTVKEPTSVSVRVRIDRAGRVSLATSEDGNQVLRDAAIEAAKKATFSVEKLRGRGAEGTITYTFK